MQIKLVVGVLVVSIAILFTLFNRSIDPTAPDDLTDWSTPPPWPVFTVMFGFSQWLERFLDRLTPPPILAFKLSTQLWETQAIHIIAKLKVADYLSSGPKSIEDIAKHVHAHPERLYRLMRWLSTRDFFYEIEYRVFRNSPQSAVFRMDHPNSMNSFFQMLVEHGSEAWAQIGEAVMDVNEEKRTPFEIAHNNVSFWNWMRKNPDIEKRFSEGMAAIDHLGRVTIIDDFEWSKYKRIVDVGGAYGSAVSGVLMKNPGMTGIVVDQKLVVERALEFWKTQRPKDWELLNNRMTFKVGDFFNAETLPKPEAGDLWVFGQIFHDWPDKDVIKILTATRTALGNTDATVLIVEVHPEDMGNLPLALACDVHMMVLFDAAERTPTHWKKLFEKTGFRYGTKYPTRSMYRLLTVHPIPK